MILKEVEQEPITGERIVKIASSFMYAETGSSVYGLLEELKEPYQHAIAVVDESRKVRGIIVPQDLVEILGKPFGRDLLKRQNVEDIMKPAIKYRYDEYIQEIRDRVSGDLESKTDSHYVLVDDRDVFRGHVSSHDILIEATSDHQRELETAITIQSRLVHPYFFVKNKRLSITCSSVMAQGVGGDYYYVKEYAQGEWFFCLCDISGKGLSAAIITAVLAGFMYNANFRLPLEEIVKRLNTIILETFKLEKYLTGVFLKFSEETGELEYCDMGHSYLYAVEGVSVQQIADTADNVPIGLVENPTPIVRTLRIAPGTILILLSDGIVEQENSAGESFTIQEMGQHINASISKGEDPIRAKIRIFESFFKFKKEMPQHDDISMLLFHYKNNG